MENKLQAPVLLDYMNYREFLKDLFPFLRKTEQQFSQKRIMLELGIGAGTGFLSNILSGKKNLTVTQAQKLPMILKLSRTDAQYFELLVFFTQARTVEEKNELFARMMTLQTTQLKTLNKRQMCLFSKWYFVFVREVLDFFPVKKEYAALGKMLDPPISAGQAREAVDVLLKLDLLERDNQGFLVQKEQAVSSGNEVRNKDLANFQIYTMELGKRALQTIPAPARDISVMTLSFSADNFRLAKSEIQHFRKRLARLAVEDKSADCVYQLNTQFFPVSTTRKESAS